MNGTLYVVPELTTTFQQWVNRKEGFIANKIMPEVMVDNEKFIVWSGGKEHLTIPSNTLRFGRAKYPESTFSRATAEKGPVLEHGLSSFITERQYKLGGSSLSVENQVVEGIASQMALLDEKDVADTLSDTAVVTHYLTKSGTGQWSDKANSNPFNDIVYAVTQQRIYSPAPANSAWISMYSWLQIVDHPDFLARIGVNNVRTMTPEMFLQVMAPYGIKNLYIADVRYNSGKEGLADSMGDVWGKHFWVGYITDTPGQQEINGGYKFTLRDSRKVFKEQSMNPPGAEVVDTETYDHILLSSDVYFLIQNVVA